MWVCWGVPLQAKREPPPKGVATPQQPAAHRSTESLHLCRHHEVGITWFYYTCRVCCASYEVNRKYIWALSHLNMALRLDQSRIVVQSPALVHFPLHCAGPTSARKLRVDCLQGTRSRLPNLHLFQPAPAQEAWHTASPQRHRNTRVDTNNNNISTLEPPW